MRELLLDQPMELKEKKKVHQTLNIRIIGEAIARCIPSLAAKAQSTVRDLDPNNQLTFLRIKSKMHEIMVAPDKDFLLIVV